MINKKTSHLLDEDWDFKPENLEKLIPTYEIISTYADGSAMSQTVETYDIENYVSKMTKSTCVQILSAVAKRIDNIEKTEVICAVRDYKNTASWYFTSKRRINSEPLK